MMDPFTRIWMRGILILKLSFIIGLSRPVYDKTLEDRMKTILVIKL